MTALRWGDEVPAGPDAARRRLVTAARACIGERGLARTTVEDVARAAKVSRATIYRYFDDRDELVLAALLDGLGESIDRDLTEFLRGATDPEAFAAGVVDALVYLLDVIRHDPTFEVLLDRETGGISATITGASEALFGVILDEWRPTFQAAQDAGQLRRDIDVDDLAEWILRCLLSLLTVEGPEAHTPETERRLLATFLAPSLLPAAGERSDA